MTATKDKTIVLAAGGTGGHMFPAEALARELLARGWTVNLVTDKRGGAFGDTLPEVAVHRIRAATLGSGLMGKVRTAVELFFGTFQARALLKRLKPTAVVGFGGYPSVPTVFAAGRAGIPVVLHEQNAILGRANRMLSGVAARIATSFPSVAGVKEADRAKLAFTGNPVRPHIAAVREVPYPAYPFDGPLYLMVMGGSQGARIFSQVIPQALALIPEHLRRRIRLSQQCRAEDLDLARQGLTEAGVVEPDLSSFFTDVPQRLADCHLAVCRAGASTVAELSAVGRPAILVPYPFAMDDHQTANAEAVSEAGAAWLIPQPAFTPQALAARLEALLTLPESLERAAGAARAWGRVDAAARLADAVESLIGVGGNGANGNHHHAVEAAE
ncbi:MAG TPA: undecaprenyldiphospho-muramoylpentapeptide beta-N-acetylglucosaminyltransferase [Azospirillaceae bacterium]|nr:undecaprenyldiphospho-muramoylpentapeptide beta-N-acetylglucosaminyltransferase [Azospirillaceae bacterium]